jgi:hypothetical protein
MGSAQDQNLEKGVNNEVEGFGGGNNKLLSWKV